MIRVVLADMLDELGYTVAAEAASIEEALEATRKTDFDLAILDADLKGRSVSLIADALVARDIRFVFVTGYGDHGLPAYRDRPSLNNPSQTDAIRRVCKSALGRGGYGAFPHGGRARRERGAGKSAPLLVLNSCLPAEPRFSSTARKNFAAAEQNRLRRIHDIRRATERL